MPISTKPIPTTNPSGAIIAYDNFIDAATITLDTSDPTLAVTPNTWERWRPNVGNFSAKFQLTNIVDVNCIGIAAHNLSGETLIISTAATVGGALTTVESVSPTDNKPIFLTFEARVTAEVIITSTLSAANEIGVVFAGNYMQMPVALYGGHSPIALSQKTEYQSTESDTGQFLGRSITRQGTIGDFAWRYIEPDWYRSTFQPFVVSARTEPFFIQWRPDYHPNEIAYCHTTSDIKPQNMGGGHTLMSVSIKVMAHNDV